MTDSQSNLESDAWSFEALTLENSVTEDGTWSESASTTAFESVDTSAFQPYSRLCRYCQTISDRLIEVKQRQEAYDTEYYSKAPPDAYSSPSWPSPPRKTEHFLHYHTEQQLDASANAGCALCARLLEGDRYGEPTKYEGITLDNMTAVLTWAPSRERADQWQIMLRQAWKLGNVVNIYIKITANQGKLCDTSSND